jgi:transcriptional regulator with XRE-family HTH domain
MHFMQTNGVNAALGAKVRDLRLVHGWSQAELAQRFGDAIGVAGFNPSQITRMERGQRPFPIHETVALVQILGIELRDFLKFVSPLDDAVAAGRIMLRLQRDKIAGLTMMADSFGEHLNGLIALQRYQDSADVHDLVEGLAFVLSADRHDRANWREIMLSAGVAEESITAALSAADNDPCGEQFYETLVQIETSRLAKAQKRAERISRSARPAKAARS